jgi:hypothetical protein
MHGCIVQAAERAQRMRHVEMAIRAAGIDGQRAAEQFHSRRVAADLAGDDAEQMQTVGVIGIERQRVAAEPLGFSDLPGAEMAGGRGEQIGGRRWRGRHAPRIARRAGRALALLARGPPVLAVHGKALDRLTPARRKALRPAP